jgi:L-asparaginase
MPDKNSAIRLDDAVVSIAQLLGAIAIKIRILSCGGTIDKVYFDANSEFQVGAPQIESIFSDARVTFEFEIEQLLRKDSLEMTDEDRNQVRQRVQQAAENHILITHGTDTMTQTAAALENIPGKIIVLTGSMKPAQFRVSDAEFNIGCAVGALQSLSPGVYIAMSGRVFRAGTVEKNSEKMVFEEP